MNAALILQETLAEHAKWLRGEGTGTRAYLRVADLRGADLTGADLRGASLRGADLTGADLTGACLRGAYLRGGKLLARAAVQFTAHGECGRELSAIKTDAKENNTTLYCGCFAGTPEALREYIVRGDEDHVRTRTLALDTVLMLLGIQAVKS